MAFSLRLLLALLPFSAAAYAQPVEFPADAGALNVRDFGAKGDGVTDDTAAINAALAASGSDTGPAFWQDKIVYIPAGTYRISAPLEKRYADGRYASGAILIGQSRDHTIIRLQDRAPGYGDPEQPRAIIFTAAKLLDSSGATGGGKDYIRKGEGNDAFMNFVENMTIDAGKGNPGAIGIDYLANNLGAVRNVRITAATDSGATGLALTRKWPGPALLKDIVIEGFDTGIDVAHTEYGITLEHIALTQQRRMGMRNNGNVLAVHDLTITGAPLPLVNAAPEGLITLTQGQFSHTAGGEAIHNEGYLNLRNLTASGYRTPPEADGVYDPHARLSASALSWSLPIKEPPVQPYEPTARWVGVAASPEGDATEAIRQAFASGAATIYFPHGVYTVSGNIDVPSSVKHIVGMTSTIRATAQRPDDFQREEGLFRLRNNASPLVIEKLAFDNSYQGNQVAVEALGRQPLVLRDVVGAGVTTLLRPAQGGEAYLENTCCGTISVSGKQGVWARQLDTEGPGIRISNSGAPLWILGLKTEQNCTVIDNSDGARTEVLGGLIYITGTHADPAIPAFRNRKALLALSYAEESFNANSTYATHLDGGDQNITQDSLPKRGLGRMAPQLVSTQ